MDFNPLSWETYEYVYRGKRPDWYWSVGIIAAALAVTAILLGNFLLAVVITIGAFTLLLLGSRRPQIMRFTVSQNGITVGNLRYPFPSIQSFFVDLGTPGQPKILLKLKQGIIPQISLPLGNVSPDEARKLMLNFLPEEEQTEPFAHKLLERLGF